MLLLFSLLESTKTFLWGINEAGTHPRHKARLEQRQIWVTDTMLNLESHDKCSINIRGLNE